MGGTGELDTAPVFATQLTVGNLSSDQLFLATTGTCPTIAGGAITAANCANNPPITAGVLTNPGVMKHYFGNLAFRRVRWVQEIFDCTAFPAEVGQPVPVGANKAPYTAPWPFASISGTDNGGRINFHDTSAVVCANCHATMNHMAPLFANFDANGLYTTAIAVALPITGTPLATRTDWLPANEPTGWRYNTPAADLGALGRALVADPAVSTCTVARAWNFALGKGDIVSTLSVVPPDVIATEVAAFDANGRRLRDLFYRVFTSVRLHQVLGGLPCESLVCWSPWLASDSWPPLACSARIKRPPLPPAEDPGLPNDENNPAGGEDTTFDHTDPIDPWAVLERILVEGPPSYSAHVHSCMKMKYATLGRVLSSRGVNLASTTTTSAGALYTNGLQAIGVATYAQRASRADRADHRRRVEDPRHLRERGARDHRCDAESRRVHGQRRRHPDVRRERRVHRAWDRVHHRSAGDARSRSSCAV